MFNNWTRFTIINCLLVIVSQVSQASHLKGNHGDSASNKDFVSCEKTDNKEFDPWINNMIQDEKYFETNVEVADLQTSTPTISLIDEKYNCKNKTGGIQFQHRCSSAPLETCVIEYAKYFNDQSVYLSTNNTSKCEKKNLADRDVLDKFMFRYLPQDVYADGKSCYDQVLGPTSMLLHLRERIKETHKYEFKDADQIQNFGYNLCVQA